MKENLNISYYINKYKTLISLLRNLFLYEGQTPPSPPFRGLVLNNKKKRTFYIHQCPLSVKKLKDERKIRINHAITNK